MKRALIIGINYYEENNCLHGCVNDAIQVAAILGKNGDGSPNFDVRKLIATDSSLIVRKEDFIENLQYLFEDDVDTALFYYSGHGGIDKQKGGFLCPSDVNEQGGIFLSDLNNIISNSKAKNKIIILDSCHAGAMGNSEIDIFSGIAILKEGTTVLAAATANQYAVEANGTGIFTNLLVDALSGSAANILGQITPGSVYAHIDQSLGAWDQRPVFKTNVKEFTKLRTVSPSITREDLRRLVEFFESPASNFGLTPEFEPENDAIPNNQKDQTKLQQFACLQRMARVNLVVPIDETHMYHAAMNSKGCKLTALGAHYWNLVKRGRI
jgi:hypothetical protein